MNKAALYAAGVGLLPFRFAAPAVAAIGVRTVNQVREVYGAEISPVEQIAAAAVLGAGEFALGQASRAARLVPMAGPLISAALTGAAVKALGEGAILYYQWARHASEVDARPADGAADDPTRPRVSF